MKLNGKCRNIQIKSTGALNQAVAMKYQCYLSRRKYRFQCKIQKQTFDVENQEWRNNSITYGDYNIELKTRTISDEKVQKFVNSLDIGDVNILEHPVSGVSRTVTALTTMMLDINIKCKNLHNQLIWFQEVPYHFVVQFSDDGASECKDTTMRIGSLTMWNLGSRARSRDYQYILHAANITEKDPTAELLWKQHTDEMTVLEGNVFNIAGNK